MPGSLYDDDVLLWSERQADLLRRHAKGERLNEAVDWENVVEEIGDLGRSELNACESPIEQALLHLLKILVEPGSQDVRRWRGEAIAFLGRAARRYTPSMGQRLDLAGLYALASRQMRESTAGEPPWPAECPFTLDDLLPRKPEHPDIDALLARLAAITS